MLIEQASFNAFDGKRVVRDLLLNRELWKACLMDREKIPLQQYSETEDTVFTDTIKLRDMPTYWNVDTLLITPNYDRKFVGQVVEVHDPKEQEIKTKLTSLAKTWSADEIDWYFDNQAGDILRIWWD